MANICQKPTKWGETQDEWRLKWCDRDIMPLLIGSDVKTYRKYSKENCRDNKLTLTHSSNTDIGMAAKWQTNKSDGAMITGS